MAVENNTNGHNWHMYKHLEIKYVYINMYFSSIANLICIHSDSQMYP